MLPDLLPFLVFLLQHKVASQKALVQVTARNGHMWGGRARIDLGKNWSFPITSSLN